MSEFPRLAQLFYQVSGSTYYSQPMDLQYLMWKNDKKHDGRLSLKEFKKMLKELSGSKKKFGIF